MFSVLALDLATTTGWALHEGSMERPFFGAFRLPGGPHDVALGADALLRFLDEKHDLFHFTHVVFEDQFIPTAVNSKTARRLMGLAAMTEWWCLRNKVRCFSVLLVEWRKHFLGRGSGFKRTPDKKRYLPNQDPKELAIRKCAEFGWHTDIADAAEACGLLDYFLHLIAKGVPGFVIPWRDYALFAGFGESPAMVTL